MTRKLGVLISLVALSLLALTPLPAAGAAGGTSLQDAIEMNGVMQGTLPGPSTEMWFTYWDPGQLGPIGFTLNWNGANPENNNQVTMSVWTSAKSPMGLIPTEVAQGTVPGNTTGVKYWRGNSDKATRYWIAVRSGLQEKVDFAIAQTGSAYPPPGLHVTGDASAEAPAASKTPTSEGTIVPPADAPPPAAGTPPAAATPADTRGKTLGTAIPLGKADGPNRGVIPAKTSLWFVDSLPDQNVPMGVDFNYTPATVEADPHVVFKVWAYRNTNTGPILEVRGQGTKPNITGLDRGVKYWQGSAQTGYTFYVEVLNDWDRDISYGIANIGSVAPMRLPVGPE